VIGRLRIIYVTCNGQHIWIYRCLLKQEGCQKKKVPHQDLWKAQNHHGTVPALVGLPYLSCAEYHVSQEEQRGQSRFKTLLVTI